MIIFSLLFTITLFTIIGCDEVPNEAIEPGELENSSEVDDSDKNAQEKNSAQGNVEDTDTTETRREDESSIDVNAPVIGEFNQNFHATYTSIEISWTASSDDFTSAVDLIYTVCVSQSIAEVANMERCKGSGIELQPNEGLSYQATELSPGIEYYFGITVSDLAGNTALYTYSSASTLVDEIPPEAGILNSHTKISESSVSLRWTTSSDNFTAEEKLSYSLCMSPTPIAEFSDCPSKDMLFSDVFAKLDHLVENLEVLTDYHFTVFVKDESDNISSYPQYVINLTDENPPTPGGPITIKTKNTHSITFEWPMASDNSSSVSEIEYLVCVSRSSEDIDTIEECSEEANDSGRNFITSNEFQLSGLGPDTTWAVNVLVKDASDNSALYTPFLADTDDLAFSLVKDINPGAGSSSIRELVLAENKLFFLADDDVDNKALWVSDGTPMGTNKLYAAASGMEPDTLTPFGNKIVFRGKDAAHGQEPWISDGTIIGTKMIKDVVTGTSISNPFNFVALDTKVFLTMVTPTNGRSFWVTDGTETGTSLFWDPDYTIGAYPQKLTRAGNKVYAIASVKDNTVSPLIFHGREIAWVSETSYGHHNIADSALNSNPDHFAAQGDVIYFSADDYSAGRELWKWGPDTSIAPVIVADVSNFPSDSSNPEKITVTDDKVFFTADDGVNGRQVWVTTGTPGNATMLTDLSPSQWNDFYSDGKQIFFNINFGGSDNQTWTSDGTIEGTKLLIDGVSGASFCATFNGVSIFMINDGSDWYYYRTEGPTNTTRRLLNNIQPSNSAKCLIFENVLYIRLDNDSSGSELWKAE